MIKNKEDLRRFLEQDRKALGKSYKKPKFFTDEIWRFQIALRKHEYYANCNCLGGGMLRIYWNLIHKIWGILLGFTIPINVIDEGLCIYHYGYVVISKYAKIGKNCKIHAGVNIGENKGADQTPVIGDNVFIGPGAKLFGDIFIGNNVEIGANSVVNKSFGDGVVIAGVPAKVVKNCTELLY